MNLVKQSAHPSEHRPVTFNEIYTPDSDFHGFPFLRVVDPLA